MDRVNGLNTIDIGGGRRGFRDRNNNLGVPGTQITANFLNGVQEELMTLIEGAGLTPDQALFTLLARAMRSQWVNFAGVAGGTANALTLGLTPAPTSMDELARAPIRAVASFTNTGAGTVTFPGLGTFPLLTLSGRPLAYGDLRAGIPFEMAWDDDTAMRLTAPARSEIGSPLRRLPIFASGTFTAAAGEFMLHIEGWGTAGGGGRCTGSDGAGAGGGSGAYVNLWARIEPDQVIPYALGAGGSRGIISSPDGGAGGSVTVDGILSITGGAGGSAGVVGGGGTTPGAGGVATILGTATGYTFDGNSGGTATIITSTNMVGGLGGTAPFGGVGGGPNQGTGGGDGADPGGGGGGGANPAGSNGGRGGAAFLRFETYPG